jgi:hypothetical protein
LFRQSFAAKIETGTGFPLTKEVPCEIPCTEAQPLPELLAQLHEQP